MSAKTFQHFAKRLTLAAMAAAMLLCIHPAGAAITDEDIAGMSAANEAKTQTTRANDGFGEIMARTLLSLAVVVGLIGLVAWAGRKYLPKQIAPGRGGPIEVVASRSIAPRKTLTLVRVQDKTVLLAVTSQSVSFLTEIEAGEGEWEAAAAQTGLDKVVPFGGQDSK